MKTFPALAFFCLLACLLAAAADPPSVEQIADEVDRHYNRMVTLQADFVESYRGVGVNRTESGTLWLKKPGRMRWEYRQPRDKIFVTDGKTAWFYVTGDPQAHKAEMKRVDDLRSPLRYLLGRTRLMREFDGLSFAPDVSPVSPSNIVLRGVPRGLEDRVSQVLLEVMPERIIERIIIHEVDGAVTEFHFLNHKENIAVADSRFRFQVPRGVELVEMQELAP